MIKQSATNALRKAEQFAAPDSGGAVAQGESGAWFCAPAAGALESFCLVGGAIL